MAARIYSERLLHGRSGGATQTITVPTGFRAVVRFASIVTFSGTPAYVVLRVAGVPVVWMDTPTANVTKHFDLRNVAYAGETVEIVTSGGDVAWSVSGFMFTDA